jgi:hypothetical protein
MWGRTRTIHRKETMIALRARRRAIGIAREVAHPHVEFPRPPQPMLREPWREDELEYEPLPCSFSYFEEPVEAAPPWFLWPFVVSLTITTTPGVLLIKYLG